MPLSATSICSSLLAVKKSFSGNFIFSSNEFLFNTRSEQDILEFIKKEWNIFKESKKGIKFIKLVKGQESDFPLMKNHPNSYESIFYLEYLINIISYKNFAELCVKILDDYSLQDIQDYFYRYYQDNKNHHYY